MKKLLFLMAMAGLVAGCAFVGTQEAWSPQKQNLITTHFLNWPADNVYQVTLYTVREAGYPVLFASKDSRTITTDWLDAYGEIKIALTGGLRRRLYFKIISQDNNQSILRLNIMAENYGVERALPADREIKQQDYDEWFGKIELRLVRGY